MASVYSLICTAGELAAWCCSRLGTALQAVWTAVRQAYSSFWVSDRQQLDYDPSIFEVDYDAVNAEFANIGFFDLSADNWVVTTDHVGAFNTSRLQGGPAENRVGDPDGDEAIEDE